MKAPRIDIASIRREQIVDAAAAVIAEQGIQNLSLSEIEKKVGMSRGQLTYYFKAKEDILVAVFDHMLALMFKRHGGEPDMKVQDHPFFKLAWLDFLAMLLRDLMRQPPRDPAFHALHYTFLSQISHRADFRDRLAKLYEKWRSDGTVHVTRDLKDGPAARPVSPRALATLTQAIIHGLVVQTAVDAAAFDHEEVIELCVDMMRDYLWPASSGRSRSRLAEASRLAPETPLSLPVKKTTVRTNKRNGAARPTARLLRNGVKHERT